MCVSGSMLGIGRSNFFKFNHPAEANYMKSLMPNNARVSMMQPLVPMASEYSVVSLHLRLFCPDASRYGMAKSVVVLRHRVREREQKINTLKALCLALSLGVFSLFLSLSLALPSLHATLRAVRLGGRAGAIDKFLSAPKIY
jgi:hypothetical protein